MLTLYFDYYFSFCIYRQGSVIADVQLRFESNAIEPLSVLEKAIKTGRCADLEVEKSFFEILLPNLSKFIHSFIFSFIPSLKLGLYEHKLYSKREKD